MKIIISITMFMFCCSSLIAAQTIKKTYKPYNDQGAGQRIVETTTTYADVIDTEIELQKYNYQYKRWYSFGRAGKADRTKEGCGVSAARTYLSWWNVDYTTKQLSKIMRTDSFSWVSNNIFMTPAWMSVDLQKVLKPNLWRFYKKDEIETVRHRRLSKNELAIKIAHHLKRGIPVIALVNDGNHWVTITAIKYRKNRVTETIDFNSVDVQFVSNSRFNHYTSLSSLKITGWNSDFWPSRARNLGYTSYLDGTLVALRNDKLNEVRSWKDKWRGRTFKVNNKNFIYLYRTETGKMHIREITDDGKIGKTIQKTSWSKGWTTTEFFEQNGRTYMFLLKKSSGLVHIRKMNNDGTYGPMVANYDWSSGWHRVRFVKSSMYNLLALAKENGNLNLHWMNTNGKVGTKIYSGNIGKIFDFNMIRSSNGKFISLTTVDSFGKSHKQYKLTTTNATAKLTLNKEQAISGNWSKIDSFPVSSYEQCYIMHESTSLKQNVKFNTYKLSRASLDGLSISQSKLTDQNHFKAYSIYSDYNYEQRRTVNYFKAANGELKLLVINHNTGRVEIFDMDKDCGFRGRPTIISSEYI